MLHRCLASVALFFAGKDTVAPSNCVGPLNEANGLGSRVAQPHLRGVVSTTSNSMDGAQWLRRPNIKMQPMCIICESCRRVLMG